MVNFWVFSSLIQISFTLFFNINRLFYSLIPHMRQFIRSLLIMTRIFISRYPFFVGRFIQRNLILEIKFFILIFLAHVLLLYYYNVKDNHNCNQIILLFTCIWPSFLCTFRGLARERYHYICEHWNQLTVINYAGYSSGDVCSCYSSFASYSSHLEDGSESQALQFLTLLFTVSSILKLLTLEFPFPFKSGSVLLYESKLYLHSNALFLNLQIIPFS